MFKLSECTLAKKLQASNNKGLIVGVSIGVLICLIIVGILLKVCCLKKKFDFLHYDMDELDIDFDDDDDDCACDCSCDENGCNYTSDKDFV